MINQIIFDFTGVWIQMFILTIIFVITIFIFFVILALITFKNIKQCEKLTIEFKEALNK